MFIKKRGISQIEGLLGEILDAQNADMLIARGDDCRILFMSSAAREHLHDENLSTQNCKEGYAKIFHGLCSQCPNNQNPGSQEPETLPCNYDVRDENGRIIAVTGTNVTWTDKAPATALFLRDVDDMRSIESKLYNLAYKDQLTGMPNRQKLLEDSESIQTAKKNGMCGVVAMLDLDNFKAVNDTYGHNTGDIMLKRLTEHLSSDPAFKDHLYRLGGDEFVLLYQDSAEKFETGEDLRNYYGDILKNAFYSYTLPNIDISCTVSMGVAFFPLHGENISEMLRKADIALYKSKANGRNQMTFFDNRFEVSKKFKNFYINIQPILTSRGATHGYELIDSGNENENDAQRINLSEFDRAIDALGLDDMRNDNRYFIAYSHRMHNKSTIRNLPKNKFIIQIQTPAKVTEADFEIYRALRCEEFLLCFTDLNAENATPELMEFAEYCRFDPNGVSEDVQRDLIASYRSKKFIATHIDKKQDYDRASALGFKLFQGIFFDQPAAVKKEKDIEPLKLNYLRLLKLTSTEDYVDFSQISDVIASDVALSYKLLRLLNSAALGLRHRMSSISMAVSYLGEESLKKWIALLSLRGVAQDKPIELVRISLIRAQFGELLAAHMRPMRDKKHIFLTGMFSLLHIAMEKTKEELMEEIPVAEDIKESILTREGPYSGLLQFFDDYENSNWDAVTKFADQNHLSNQIIYESYISSIKWYNSLVGDAD